MDITTTDEDRMADLGRDKGSDAASWVRELTIGDMSRDGLLQIVDTNWDGNGTLRVTVREMIGGGDAGWIGGMPIARMRRLARRAMPHPELTRSARIVNRFMDNTCGTITFAVSRLERDY